MKVSKEEDFLNEREKILKKVGKKTQLSKIKQSENKEQKMKFITEIQIKNKDAVKAIQDKLQLHHNELEEERLILQEKLEERLDKISRKNKDNLIEIKNKFGDRSMRSLDKFNENYTKVLLKNDKKHRDNVERPMLNYEDWYIRHLTEAKKEKAKKKRRE